MEMTGLDVSAATLGHELEWIEAVIDASIRIYFGQPCRYANVRDVAPPTLAGDACAYTRAVQAYPMRFEERLVLVLALIPHVRPQLLDPFLTRNENFGRGFTEFGGVSTGAHGGFWPTVETAAFILAGTSLAKRLALQSLFDHGHFLVRDGWIEPPEAAAGQPMFSSALTIGREKLGLLTAAPRFSPAFSNSFPARLLTTPLAWSDLVLGPGVADEVNEIRAWIEHRDALVHEWRLGKHIKAGFRSLFYGPSGTGKTLTASLLGKATGLDVYRIDLSMVVSKYVGETEKNLGAVFDQAARHDWILFFDEADALFGKRTQTSSSNDRYANQEVAYLLQRVEDFPGIVMLASNLKGNIDEAFARRFQSMIYFPMPSVDERLRLWRNAFAHTGRLDPEVDLARVAREYDMAGGAISNVLRSASLAALRRGAGLVSQQDLEQGIRRELRKEGKIP
jgi:hypothetical protein